MDISLPQNAACRVRLGSGSIHGGRGQLVAGGCVEVGACVKGARLVSPFVFPMLLQSIVGIAIALSAVVDKRPFDDFVVVLCMCVVVGWLCVQVSREGCGSTRPLAFDFASTKPKQNRCRSGWSWMFSSAVALKAGPTSKCGRAAKAKVC